MNRMYNKYNYIPLDKPTLVTEQVWPEDTLPLVSVSTLTYNHEPYIREAIESFLMQKTTFPIQIVIFDDVSTDGTREIVKEYESKYPNLIKGVYPEINTYGKPERNEALKPYFEARAISKYIALCEGDDYWTDPLKLQKQVDFLEENEEYGLVYTEVDKLNQRTGLITSSFLSNNAYSFCKSNEDYLIYAPFRAPCTWMFRKKLIKPPLKNYIVGDLPLFLDILLVSKIHQLIDTTAVYRVLENSASHFTDIRKEYSFMKGIFEIKMDYALKFDVDQKTINTIQKKFAKQSYYFAVALNDEKQIELADRILKNEENLSIKFKIVQLLRYCKLGRFLVKIKIKQQ